MQNSASNKKNQLPLLLLFLSAILLSLICVSSATLLAISMGTQNEINANILAQSNANYQQEQSRPVFGQLNPEIILDATRDGASLSQTPMPSSLGDMIQNGVSTAVAQIFPTPKPALLPPPVVIMPTAENTETAVPAATATASATPRPSITPIPATSTATGTAIIMTPTPTLWPTVTLTNTPFPTSIPTATQPPVSNPPPTTNTPQPTATATFTPIPTATSTNTAVPTATATATATTLPTATATATSTATPTATATAAPVDVFFDDFENDLGWTTNPNGSDTATTGMWERSDPEETTYDSLIYQLGTTVSGNHDLVTAGALGSISGPDVGANDVDNGTTSIRSPNISLPSSGTLTLSFNYYLSHYSNSGSNDYLRISIVGNTTVIVLEELGANDKDPAVWDSFNTNLDSFAGETIYILIEACDGGIPSLVEAGIDDVHIVSN